MSETNRNRWMTPGAAALAILVLCGTWGLGGMARAERPSLADLQAQIDDLRQAQPGPSAFLGEIRLFAGLQLPDGWLPCDGRLLALNLNTALFRILGNAHGGDGRTTFALPDLRGRVPMGIGAGPGLTTRRLGERTGVENVVLDATQMPSHDHALRATNSSATQTQPSGNILARAATPQYLNASASVVMGADAIGASGSNAPHVNVQPSNVLNFIIAVSPQAARPRFAGTTWDATVRSEGPPGTRVVTDDAFSSGGIDYVGLEFLLHIPGEGNVWVAVPQANDLETAPINPMIVLDPAGAPPAAPPPPRWPLRQASGPTLAIDLTLPGVDLEGRTAPFALDAFPGADDTFTSGGLTYIPLEFLAFVVGIGNVWLAIPKSHDLSSEPIVPVIVLDPNPPDVVAPGQTFPSRFVDITPFPRPRWPLQGSSSGGTHVVAPLEFSSAGIDYQTLEFLDHNDGVGTIWAAVITNHALDTAPVAPVIVLAPDTVTPTD